MAKSTSIVERDLEFYTGCVEGCTDRLFRCFPEEEARMKRERQLAGAVAAALQQLADFYREGRAED